MEPKNALTNLVKRPMGAVFIGMLLFGVFLLLGDNASIPEILKTWPVYGVFIIPAIVGIVMILLTADEVSKIHKRFDGIDAKLSKLDNIETKLDKLDNIETILREIAGYLRPKQ